MALLLFILFSWKTHIHPWLVNLHGDLFHTHHLLLLCVSTRLSSLPSSYQWEQASSIIILSSCSLLQCIEESLLPCLSFLQTKTGEQVTLQEIPTDSRSFRMADRRQQQQRQDRERDRGLVFPEHFKATNCQGHFDMGCVWDVFLLIRGGFG